MFLRSAAAAFMVLAAGEASATPPPLARVPAIVQVLMGRGVPQELAEAMKVCEEQEVHASADEPHVDPDGALEGGSVPFKFLPAYAESCATIRGKVISQLKAGMADEEARKKAAIDALAKSLR
jgi:hypothetical protein